MKSTGKRDTKDRSKKDCCCGGHSANDRKKCKYHHGTASKLNIRKTRQAVLEDL